MRILGICADATSDKRLRSAVLLYNPVTILDEDDVTLASQLSREFDEMSKVATGDELHEFYCTWRDFLTEYNGRITFSMKQRQTGYYLITKIIIT